VPIEMQKCSAQNTSNGWAGLSGDFIFISVPRIATHSLANFFPFRYIMKEDNY
jgi:hypothetical protein